MWCSIVYVEESVVQLYVLVAQGARNGSAEARCVKGRRDHVVCANSGGVRGPTGEARKWQSAQRVECANKPQFVGKRGCRQCVLYNVEQPWCGRSNLKYRGGRENVHATSNVEGQPATPEQDEVQKVQICRGNPSHNGSNPRQVCRELCHVHACNQNPV